MPYHVSLEELNLALELTIKQNNAVCSFIWLKWSVREVELIWGTKGEVGILFLMFSVSLCCFFMVQVMTVLI